MDIEIIGWLGSTCFSLCAWPQALSCYKEGHGRGLSHTFLWLWAAGEVLFTIYVLVKHGFDLPLLSNYLFNSLSLCVIMKYKYFERITP